VTQRPTDPAMTCAEIEGLLEPFVDDELEAAEAAALRSHLAECPACSAELALAERIRTGLRTLPELDPSPSILERVRAQAAAESAKVVPLVRPFRPARAVRRWVIPAAVAAALAGLLATTLLLRFQRPAPSPTTAEVQAAEQQARYALAYIGRATRQASLTLRDDVLEKRVVLPTALSVERPLDPRPGLILEHHLTKGT
jgi:anti-sigma factor RsiW